MPSSPDELISRWLPSRLFNAFLLPAAAGAGTADSEPALGAGDAALLFPVALPAAPAGLGDADAGAPAAVAAAAVPFSLRRYAAKTPLLGASEDTADALQQQQQHKLWLHTCRCCLELAHGGMKMDLPGCTWRDW